MSRPDRSAEYAARIKATVVSAGGRYTKGRRALIREAGLTTHTGDVGLKRWRLTDQGTDGVAVNVMRGPRFAHYAKTTDEAVIERIKLRDDLSAWRKVLQAYTTCRAELEAVDPGQDLARFQRLIAEQTDREFTLARLERVITKQARTQQHPARDIENWFAMAPPDARA